ncbi:MAG TPA: hypothetical protein VNF68_07245 [Candidatus Baltobacteraceae bacterium]|nr:hypothetical protein [Candidatus Baltobacteraceae bacterium]
MIYTAKLDLHASERGAFGGIQTNISNIAATTTVTFETVADLQAHIRTFATTYGRGCAVFARLQNALRKPRGFDAMLAENRYFNLETAAHAPA